MKGAYIVKRNIMLNHTAGVDKKVIAQNEAFQYLGADMDLYSICGNSICKNDESIYSGIDKLKGIFKNKIFYTIVFKKIKEEKYDFIYFRYAYATPLFIKFISKLKQKDLSLKIVVEIPTYPYKGEVVDLKRFILNQIDKTGIPHLKKYVDRIVTFYGQNEIHGISTIRMGNGIDTSKVSMLTNKNKKQEKKIILVAVADLKFFHGYDRVIQGLASNMTEYKVEFNVVGEGPELSILKKLVEQLGVQHLVNFHGFKAGKDLEEIVESSDIAVSTLGMHRKGLFRDSSLKTREYCTMGIPFILSSPDSDFEENFEYQLKIPQDDSNLNIDDVVKFYNKMKGKNYNKFLYLYAMKNLDWKVKLKKVLDFVRNG